MTFETILCCIMIPVVIVLAYIAGKNEFLEMIGEMLEDKAKKLKERRYDKYYYLRDNRELLAKADAQGYLDGFDFAIIMRNFMISKDGWVIDTGNWENVNAEVALRLERKIKEHPYLWRFFMVA